MTEKRQNYDVLDAAKFVLAFFVVAIHSGFLPNILFPWVRVAVPLFFLISSFIFFKRIMNLTKEDQVKALKLMIKRNLLLYGIWFVILLPVTLHVQEALFADGISKGTLLLLKEFLLGNGFLASWFIVANMVAVVIIYFLAKKMNGYLLLVITGLLNGLCCLVSVYKGIPCFAALEELITPIFGNIQFNFVVALFWATLGKMFAEGKVGFNKKASNIYIYICRDLCGAAVSRVLAF